MSEEPETMARRQRSVSRLLAVSVLLLAACGSSGAGSSAGAPSASSGPSLAADARSCRLLTGDEAQTAFAQTFEPPAGVDTETGGSCRYFNKNGFGLQVEINSGPDAATVYETERSEFGAGAKDLPGVGDEAFEYLQGTRQIMFLKGGTLVSLYSASRIDEEKFRELARLAAGRLP